MECVLVLAGASNRNALSLSLSLSLSPSLSAVLRPSSRFFLFVRVPAKVDCPDRQAERALVATLLRLNPTSPRPVPEVATVSAVSLQEGRALLEVPVEGALTAQAWLAAAAAEGRAAVSNLELATVAGPVGLEGTPAAESAAGAAAVDFANEQSQVEVWAVMLQALRGLAAVHGLSDGSTHRAVCLANILVAARPCPRLPPAAAGGAAGAATSTSGFRRSQLGPPAPAALASPSAACTAPEVVRGQRYTPAADVYAFGCALRAACCGADRKEEFYAAVGGGDGGKGNAGGGGGSTGVKRGVLPTGLGPSFGPLREVLAQLLEKMLEEDPSRRCTALEVRRHRARGCSG